MDSRFDGCGVKSAAFASYKGSKRCCEHEGLVVWGAVA